MKKKYGIILILLIAYLGFIFYKYNERMNLSQGEKTNLTVVTSFYPMYIHTSAIMQGTPHQVVNMADQTVGCLHDYQLTVGDTKKLYEADILVINGLGSETFIEKAYTQNPELKVIDASAHLLNHEDDEYEHEEESNVQELHENEQKIGHIHEEDEAHDDHEHEHLNDHIWLSIEGAKEQIDEITSQLSSIDPMHKAIYEANAKAYLEALNELKEEGNILLSSLKDKKAVSVHDAFYYLAKEWGIDIVETIPEGSYENASAKQIEALIQKMKEEEVEIIFTEARNQDLAILKTIQKEIPCEIYILDALVTQEVPEEGDTAQFEYVRRMRKNIQTIGGAYKK